MMKCDELRKGVYCLNVFLEESWGVLGQDMTSSVSKWEHELTLCLIMSEQIDHTIIKTNFL